MTKDIYFYCLAIQADLHLILVLGTDSQLILVLVATDTNLILVLVQLILVLAGIDSQLILALVFSFSTDSQLILTKIKYPH